jgi:plastocyanin
LGFGVLAALDSRTNKIVWKKEFRVGGPSGALATAGGLVFQIAGDGNMQAYEATNGSLVWQFQTGAAGGSPPITFERAGEQYVATVVGSAVWAFKLGGTLPARPAPAVPPQEDFAGPITDTANIETAALARDMGLTGAHYFTDEFEFNPYRVRVKAGTRVSWRNNGRMTHTVVAEDGSWSTGALSPLDTGTVTFDKPGTFTYICKEHPWVYGQIIVQPAPEKGGQSQSSLKAPDAPSQGAGARTQSQAQQAQAVERGRKLFVGACGSCHGEDATGGRGTDLIRSSLVRNDKNGDLMGPAITVGRPDRGMPGFPLDPAQVADIVAFLHAQIAVFDMQTHGLGASAPGEDGQSQSSGRRAD